MQSYNVLIADDDLLTRLDLRHILESLGHTVVAEAKGGYEACRLARECRPSVAILDAMMPNGSGIEAASILNQERVCPVVLLTAYTDDVTLERATAAGVMAYLVKPVCTKEINPAMAIATARYRELTAIESERDAIREQLETEEILRKARRVLMRRLGIHGFEAQRRIDAKVLSTGLSQRAVAEAIVLTDDIESPSR